ncbi:hypothetical protein NM688_g709 [Phlebia brevispora]|uniref:Uncharacterized protein n=1 Tax=Phlebia brevispora TaxID=194682 RepID=A0ACC1TDX7_9APHY|nr:hypothetical protein NM688_g709 [Phlebia brevispora]
MAPTLKPVDPKSERWEPAENPNDINVPGLDTSASVNDQIEQIEQLITIKLQSIDANFSKIQQIMASRILPAVKRYAVGTEPVREAAKFWTTFYEQAAQIRVPTCDDYSLPQDSESEVEKESLQEASTAETTVQEPSNQLEGFDASRTASEDSFAPGQAAISSTPARPKSQYGEDEPTPSWSASIESPLVRLDRELQSLTEEDQEVAPTASVVEPSHYEDQSRDVTEHRANVSSFADETIQPPLSAKGKAKVVAEPLLRGVLRRNSTAASQSAIGVSPLKVKQRTPNIKSLNPYLPPDSKPSDWKGVVKLSDPRVLTPGRSKASPTKQRATSQTSGARRTKAPQFDDDEDSFDVGLGMSPPITMDFARPPSSKAPKLGRTPKKQAAERIMRNLVSTEKSSTFSSARPISGIFSRPAVPSSIESSISSVPSPPSFTKYSRHAGHPSSAEGSSSIADASLESMMRRVGLNVPGFSASSGNSASKTDSLPSVPTSAFLPANTSQTATSGTEQTPQMPQFDFSRVQVDDDLYGNANNSLDSEDSFDDANNTAQPSAAFMMAVASQQPLDDDDSFDSNPNDSIDFADAGDIVNPHPFAQMNGMIMQGDGFDEDDSFDDPVFDQRTEEETLFGVPPAQRIQAHVAFQSRMSSGGSLHMAGQDLLDDTLGIGAQRAKAGHVEETPTPWGGVREH